MKLRYSFFITIIITSFVVICFHIDKVKNQEIVNERKGFLLTLSLVQDSLEKGDVEMALSLTNEKIKKIGTQQTEVLINKPELLMSSY